MTAITVPVIYNNNKWAQYKSATFKVLAALNQANILWHARNGEVAECGYWKENPYRGKGCTSVCKGYNSSGNCTGFICEETGDSIPSDYNGNFKDCKELYNFWTEVMNVQKICDSNAYENGCIPKYEGNDTAYKAKNADSTDEDANMATSDCAGFHQSTILANKAFVLTDGTIIFPYSTIGARLIAVDVNGFKGPNKWGYDVHPFYPKGNLNEDSTFYPGGCEFTERGGITGNTLLYKK